MNKSQFLDGLRRGLAGMRQPDADDIIADYTAHFEIGAAHGRSEEEIAQSLGDPQRLARELRAEAQVRAWEQRPSPANFFAVLFAFIGLAAVDFVVLLPLLGWLALFALVTIAACLGLIVAGLAAMVAALHGAEHPATHFARLFTGLSLVSLGTAAFASLLLLARWVVDLLARFARLHYRLLKQAEVATR